MAISIDFLSNVRPFLKGTDDVEGALEKVGGSLDDLAKDGGQATERLERSFKELADTAKRETATATRAMRNGYQDASSSARRNLDEIKNEAKQNAAETFSSFTGSVDSFADGIQGTLGGLIASLPPQLAVLGAAGALGLGLIVGKAQEGAQRTEEWRARTQELVELMIQGGDQGSEWLGNLVDELRQLASESEPGKTNLKELAAIADRSVSSYRDLAQAYAGNADKLDDLVASERKLKEQLEDRSSQLDITTEAGRREYEMTIKQIAGKDDYIAKLTEAQARVKEITTAEELYVQSGAEELDRKAQLIGAIDKAYDDAAGAVQDYINDESGLLDVGAYITAMQARQKALADYQTSLASSGLSDEAKSFLNDQGAEAAASFLAGYVAATPEQKAELNRIWTEAAEENSGTYASTLGGAFAGTSVAGPTVTLQDPDADALINRLQGQLRGRRVNVTVHAVTPYGVDLDG